MLTEQQRIDRRASIGSSDIPKILGLSRYGGPVQVCLEKWGQGEIPSEETDHQWLGNVLERPLGEWFARGRGVELEWDVLATAQESPIFTARHDFLVVGAPEGGECKSAMRGDEWGTAHTDQIPIGNWFQAMWQCGVSRLDRVWVPAMVAGKRGLWVVEAQPTVIAQLFQHIGDWWEKHVVGGMLPEPAAADLDILKTARREERTVEIDPQVVLEWREARNDFEAAEKAEQEARAKVLTALGDEAGFADRGDAGEAGSVSFRLQKGRRTVVGCKLEVGQKCQSCGTEAAIGNGYRVLRYSSKKKGK